MTDDQVYEISIILHGEWANAAIRMDAVKGEKNDGSKDWESFHEARLVAASENEERLFSLMDDYKNENRAVINKVFGL